MKMVVELELLPEAQQPKHSARYGFKRGDPGLESIYIKRSAFAGEAPRRIRVVINEDE